MVAYCNATASAQLAAQYPTSGGTYVYGRERLGEWWGFLAGWGFVIGKTASCAAMALTFAAYAVPPAWQRPVAVAAVLALAAVNYRGVTRTARLTRVIVAVVLLTLAVVVAAGLLGGKADPGHLTDGVGGGPDVYGVLQSAGLLFFAFAGYARIATMGEEVRDPQHTIPRAIVVALAIAVAVYAVVAVAVLLALGPDRLAASRAPLADAVAGRWLGVGDARRGGGRGCRRARGAAGADRGDRPHHTGHGPRRPTCPAGWPRFTRASGCRTVPRSALAVIVCLLVLTVDLRGAIGFSSFGVLVYYLIANLSAFTQPVEQRRFPRWLQVLGAAGCVLLVATLPWQAVVAGLGVFAVGMGYRATRLRFARS